MVMKMMKNGKTWIGILVVMLSNGQVAHAQNMGVGNNMQLNNPAVGSAMQMQSQAMGSLPPNVRQLMQKQNIQPEQLQAIMQNGLPSGLQQQQQMMQQMNTQQSASLPSFMQKSKQQPIKLASAAPNNAMAQNAQNAQMAAQLAAQNAQNAQQETLQYLEADRKAKKDYMFEETLDDALPLSADQIREAKTKMLTAQRAAAGFTVIPPKPVSTSLLVDLSPGAQPPVIRISQGFVSSLVFVDNTGAPTPIEAIDNGNSSAFNIQWNKGHIILVQGLTSSTYGNLAVKLVGLPTPVMLSLIPGQKLVDYRVDLRIKDWNGPNAQPAPIINGIPSTESDELLNVLEGVAPTGSRILQVKGAEAQAWLWQGNIYLRTRLTVLSPGWLATLSSADGMKAYLMQRTSTVLVSQNGKAAQLKIEGL